MLHRGCPGRGRRGRRFWSDRRPRSARRLGKGGRRRGPCGLHAHARPTALHPQRRNHRACQLVERRRVDLVRAQEGPSGLTLQRRQREPFFVRHEAKHHRRDGHEFTLVRRQVENEHVHGSRLRPPFTVDAQRQRALLGRKSATQGLPQGRRLADEANGPFGLCRYVESGGGLGHGPTSAITLSKRRSTSTMRTRWSPCRWTPDTISRHRRSRLLGAGSRSSSTDARTSPI